MCMHWSCSGCVVLGMGLNKKWEKKNSYWIEISVMRVQMICCADNIANREKDLSDILKRNE